MMEIVDLTGKPHVFQEQIKQAVADIDYDAWGDRDSEHLIELVSYMAHEGDAKARQLLYDVFQKYGEHEQSLAAHAIIELDGVAGFVVVAEKLAAIKRQKKDQTWDFLVTTLEEAIGETEAREALQELRATNADVDYYLGLVDQKLAGYDSRRDVSEKEYRRMPYSEVRRRVNEGIPTNVGRWGRLANDENLRAAAEDVVQETDERKTRWLLDAFHYTPFPLDPVRLLPLMDMNDSVPGAVLRALRRIKHPVVRELALSLLDHGEYSGDAVQMLALNYQAGDWTLIETLTEAETTANGFHHIGWAAFEVFEKYPDSSAINALLNIYEKGPCSFCRFRALRFLASLAALTDDIRRECLYDSNQDIRELARNEFQIIDDS